MLFLCNGCGSKKTEKPFQNHLIDYLNIALNEAVIQDGFSPPVASRIYAYCNLAAYEAYNLNQQKKINSDILNDYESINKDTILKDFNAPLAMHIAFCEVAYEMVYRDFIIDRIKAEGINYLTSNLNKKEINNSIKYGELIAQNIIEYSHNDYYEETRSYPLYEIIDEPWAWVPTPPLYGTPVEPHWGKIRPFLIDSVSEFRVAAPPPFDIEPNSEFYKLNYEIYEAVNKVTDEEKAIAMHWDGDPMPPYRQLQHVNLIKRQLNPVGHFLAIGKTLTNQLNQDESQAVNNYFLISLACADAMIACWENKYYYNLIRPHTYIIEYIDEQWDPILNTPLFPEHPSGHSCLAGAGVSVMIDLFSDTVSFVDSTIIDFGYPPRHFENLSAAAKECAFSRVYGGIHYLPSVEEGLKLGDKIANQHRKRLQ